MDMIPENQAKILWRQPPGERVQDVAVIPKRQPETPYQARRLHASSGAICSDWCDGTDDRMTTAGIFGLMLRADFEDGVFEKALSEFAKIEEAEWARQMLAGLTYRAKWQPEAEDAA